jgi:polyphenol oxidase
MPEHQNGNIQYHTFASFDEVGVKHALITRHGGVSPKPWDTLNLATTVGDDRDNVLNNVSRITDAFKIDRESLFDVWQVHSDRVICTRLPRKQHELHQKADAILTDRPGLTLLMRFADCVPILLYDPRKKVIGIVHAGWKGTVSKIVVNAVQMMGTFYGTNPKDLLAGIGPSIAVHHYEVGPDVITAAKESLGNEIIEYILSKNGSTYFDLWQANTGLLQNAGVRQIELSGICTACVTRDWFSHRGENGKSGRFGVLISL